MLLSDKDFIKEKFFADNPRLEPLFKWRDQLEDKILGTDPAIL